MSRKSFSPILWILSILYAGGLALLLSAAYWPREWWWLANVIEIMPIWVFVLPLIVLMVLSVIEKNWKLVIFQSGLAIGFLIGVANFQIHVVHPKVDRSQSIRILSLNMGPKTRLEDVQKLLNDQSPDIVVLQECSTKTFESLKGNFADQSMFFIEGSGLGIVSRFEMLETQVRNREPFGGWGSFIRYYALKTPDGVLNLFNVHLATPRDGIEALMDKKLGGISAMKAVTKSQETESFHASEWAKKYDGGVVVGDFNLQTKNPIFQKYWSYFKDAFSKQGNGFGYTKYTRWHGVRIDHVLTDQRWKIVRAYVGDDVGSDHRPLIVDLVSLLPKTEEEAPKTDVPPAVQTSTLTEPQAPATKTRTVVPLPVKPIYKEGEFPVLVGRVTDKTLSKVLVSSGIPFAPGQLSDEQMISIFDENHKEIPIATKVLARWPSDQSIRSVLVQFTYPVTKKLKKLFFKWGAPRNLKDLEIVEPVWDYPEAYIIMPPQWLCDAQVIGEQVPFGLKPFKNYDARIEDAFARMRDLPWANDVGHDDYYDTPHTFYQLYIRSGLLQYFLDARRELLHYRDTLILQEGPDRGMAKSGAQTRYVYIEALADDYLLTGDPRSLKVAGYMQEYLKKKFEPSKAFYPKGSKAFWTEREPAFPLLGVLIYYELTQNPADLEWAKEVFKNLYKTQMEYPDRGGFIHNLYAHDPEEGCKPDEYGGSPFMTGFLLEAIIKYHQITGDPQAADSIFMAVDWMINESMVPEKDTFRYMTCSAYEPNDGAPDLNLAILHAYGYAYRLTGYQEQNYFELGQRILNRGVKEGWLGDRKHFNQQFRSSGSYLAYIWEAVSKPVETSGSVDGASAESPVAIVGQHYSNSFVVPLPQDYLNLDRFQNFSFKYRLQPGDSLGIRVETHFGDWLCLGGNKSFTCEDGIFVIKPVLLLDDGEWHEISINIKDSIRTRLAGTKFVDTIKFEYRSVLGDGFDLDQVEIK